MNLPRAVMYRLAVAFILPAAAIAQTPATAPKPKPKTETQAQLQKKATITLADATNAAQKSVPEGRITSHELEREGGKLIYSFDIKIKGKSGTEEVNIDAMTGELIARTHESPADEAREKAADARKRSASGSPATGKP